MQMIAESPAFIGTIRRFETSFFTEIGDELFSIEIMLGVNEYW